MKCPPSRAGFSLVEVTVALGLVTFCLVALIGLLPVGLDSMRKSASEAAAVNCVEQISDAIRHAIPEESQPQNYKAAGLFGELAWKLGDPPLVQTWNNISQGGFPTAEVPDQQFIVRVEMTPPTSTGTFEAGSARITIAWPSQATWDAFNHRWNNAQGTVDTWLVFLPPS